jgi:hypothetical protein
MFPAHYFNEDGSAKAGAAGAQGAIDHVSRRCGMSRADVEVVISALAEADMSVTHAVPPFPGQVARVRVDAFGESAAEVEVTLLAYGGRCDAASQASECQYGECVIERNLEEQWGATYSWRGRLILTPSIGSVPAAGRAAATAG